MGPEGVRAHMSVAVTACAVLPFRPFLGLGQRGAQAPARGMIDTGTLEISHAGYRSGSEGKVYSLDL